MLIRRTSCRRGRDCAVSRCLLGSALQGRPTSCMMSGGIVQARKDAASRLECLHVQAAVMRSAGPESFLMLHTKCSRCPKPNTSRRRAGCIIAAANGQTTRGSPRRRLPVVERISAQALASRREIRISACEFTGHSVPDTPGRSMVTDFDPGPLGFWCIVSKSRAQLPPAAPPDCCNESPRTRPAACDA